MNKYLNSITHGLIVIDPTVDEDEMVNILHFVGYWEEPTQESIEHLRKELKTDKSFGLTEVVDKLVILPAPKYIIDHYKNLENE